MARGVYIRATWADGRSIDEFSKMIERRGKYLNETAFQSIHAMAIDALKALRVATKVAKPNGIKVDVKPIPYQFSYTRKVGGLPKMCLRTPGGERVESTATKIVYYNVRGVPAKTVGVFGFTDSWATDTGMQTRKYAICAQSSAAAKTCARKIVARRALAFAGLARRAISTLMVKTNTKGPADLVNARVFAKAQEVTDSRNVVATSSDGSGKYALVLEDRLRYATAATCLKGGTGAVNLALQKAANKSAGLIRKKCKDLLLPGEIKTPFPEIVKRKVA